MKSPLNLPPAAVVGALSLFLLPAAQSIGQTTATTDPVGYAQTACLANSDTLVSIPFTRPPEFVGAISSISSNTITTAGTIAVGANLYVYGASDPSDPTKDPSKTFYAIIGPNITALTSTVGVTNGSPTVTGTGLSSIVAGDELLVSGLAYHVNSVATGGASLTLDRNYTGATAAGLSASYDHSPKEGSYYTVTASGTNTVTVNLNGDSLGTVAAGTTVSLIPYWTLGTAFPVGDAGVSYIVSASAKSRGTQILLPDMVTSGYNLAAKTTYYYYGGAWVLAGGTSSIPPNDTLLLPTSYFIVHNPSTATTFTPSGGVYMNRVSVPLDTQAGGLQDNALGLLRPVNVALNDTNLISSGAFTPGTSTKNRGDLLLLYDNTATGYNKSAATYYNLSGVWYASGATGDAGSTPIPAGAGFTIRKAANGTGTTSFWQNVRTY